MIRLLHMADLHLGWEPKYLPDEKRIIRQKERDQLLRRAIDFALSPENKIQGLLLVGDLFEQYQPEESLVRETLRQLYRLTAQGMLVVTIPGNHDEITYRESVYRQQAANWPGHLVTNPMPEHCLSLRIGQVPVHLYSLAYTGGLTKTSKLTIAPRLAEPGFHIGAFHGSLDWQGLTDRSLPLTSSQLGGANYDYVALGHYHTFSQRPIGRGLAVYPGAVEFKNFRDTGTNFFTVCSWDGQQLSLEKVPAGCRPWTSISLDISAMEDFADLQSRCLALAEPEKMVQLNLTGCPGFHVRVNQLWHVLEASFFHLELNNDSRYFSNDYLDGIAMEPTVRGLFVRRIQQKIAAAGQTEERSRLQQALLLGLAALEGEEGQ